MDNLLSYCGLVDARISTYDKDLPINDTLALWTKIHFTIQPGIERGIKKSEMA